LRSFILHILFFTIASSAIAQSPCFTPNKYKACAPFKVILTNCSTTNVWYYDFGDGRSFQGDDSTKEYPDPGKYKIYQKVASGTGASPIPYVVEIEVIESRKPIYKIEACQFWGVKVTVDDDISDTYIVNFGDGTSATLNAFGFVNHTYLDHSATQRTVTIDPVDCGENVTQTISLINDLERPDIKKVTVTNQHATTGQVKINFLSEDNHSYYIQQRVSGGTYSNIDTIHIVNGGPDSVLINNLNTANNQYCFQLISFDGCGNSRTSKEICSINITSIIPDGLNDEIDLAWTQTQSGTLYYLYRNSIKPEISATTGASYSDDDVNCNVNYCYHIEAKLVERDLPGLNELESISAPQCAIAKTITSPLAIPIINSSIEGNNVHLLWFPPAGVVENYIINRSVNSSTAPFPLYENYNGLLPYIDDNVSIPGNHYCYSISYKDQCGNLSQASSATTCPIVLNVTLDNIDNTINQLSWTPYVGDNASGYQIDILDENNNVIESIQPVLSTTYTHNTSGLNVQLVRYIIRPIGTSVSNLKSNVVEIKYEGFIYLPNAFTPDGDGTNEIFMAKGKFIKDFKMTIFNRWGEVVYSGTDINEGWNGLYQNTPALTGVYAFLIEGQDLWNKNITKRGSVTLIR
jgi:gliding motility-associated-like protein